MAHSIVGGVSAEVDGGKFGHGFISAALSQGIGKNNFFQKGGTGGRIVSNAILQGTISEATGGKFANGAMSAAFRVAFNDGFNKFPSKYPGGRFATQKEATEAAHSNNQSARKIGRTEFGKYSGLRSDANGVYVYRNEDQGYFEVSNVMVIPRDGKTWALPNAAFGDSPFSETPPHINSWFGDDKTIVALVVTQDRFSDMNSLSASYQKYANKIGTVQVSTENNYHHTSYKFGITTQTFNAQSATEKYE